MRGTNLWKKAMACVLAASMALSVPVSVGAQEASGDGETLVLAYPKDLGDMNPHTMKSPMYAQDWVYDGLTQLVNGEVEPELAESWEISEDGKEYTFHLREGVKFSDGTDLTAEIVKKNIEAVIAHKDGFTFLQSLEEISEVIAQDDLTLLLKLNNPCNSLLTDFTFTRPITVAAEAAFPESGDIYEDGPAAVIGSGMWVLKEYVQDQYALFERNEYYWGEKPYYQYVKVLVIPDTDTVVNALKAGEIDMYIDVNDGLSIDAFQDLEASGFTTDVAPNTQVTSLSLNTAGEITGDVQVRTALEYATDNTAVSEYVFGGYQEPATSYFADGIAYTDVDVEPYSYDPEKAAELLDAAGWTLEDGAQYRTKDGQELEVDMLYDTVNSNGKNIGLVLQDQYAQVGVKLNICEEDSQVFRQKWADGDFGMILYSSWGGSYEPFATLAAMRTEGDKFNTVQAGLENKAELDEVMNSALSEVDTEKLQEDFDYILTTFHDGAVYIPLTVASTFAAYRSDLTGLDLSESKDTMYVGGVRPAAE